MSLDETLEKMFSDIFGTLGSSMAVKDSKERDVLEFRDGEVSDEWIFHKFSPALHFADRNSEVGVLLEGGFFFSDGLL